MEVRYQWEAIAKQWRSQPSSGYTLLEWVVVILIVGILAAIQVPSWSGLLHRSRLSIAHNQVYQAMQEAQGNARRQKVTWQVSFRLLGDKTQWAIHPKANTPGTAQWHTLDSRIELDDKETTLRKAQNVYRVEFNHRGHINGQLGRVTLAVKNTKTLKRCVIVSTLLGHLRRGEYHSKARDGRHCY